MTPDHDRLIAFFHPLFAQSGGIDSWISPHTPEPVVSRLLRLDSEPLGHAQFNQLLLLSHEAGCSEGFFEYYWLSVPAHSYDVRTVAGFEDSWLQEDTKVITSLSHLKWGLYRFYVDALLYFGNIRNAYRELRSLPRAGLDAFFLNQRMPSERMVARGAALSLHAIPRDERYLISEMACKTLDESPQGTTALQEKLLDEYRAFAASGGSRTTIRALVTGTATPRGDQMALTFAADEILDVEVTSEDEVMSRCNHVYDRFAAARATALTNTRLYLSMVDELDVYVATSMRTRDDFRRMASFCDRVFLDTNLTALNIRYFDPTLSAATGHEDKGLIECLMVRAAKMLVYTAGARDSYGKDAEAAMALSLGKPVIFFCDEETRSNFFKDIHPLSRLINFSTGVAGGAMVATSETAVVELIRRLLTNQMEYEVEQPKPSYLRLKERLTGSCVRLQTNDELLRETFWNYYHDEQARAVRVASRRAP